MTCLTPQQHKCCANYARWMCPAQTWCRPRRNDDVPWLSSVTSTRQGSNQGARLRGTQNLDQLGSCSWANLPVTAAASHRCDPLLSPPACQPFCLAAGLAEQLSTCCRAAACPSRRLWQQTANDGKWDWEALAELGRPLHCLNMVLMAMVPKAGRWQRHFQIPALLSPDRHTEAHQASCASLLLCNKSCKAVRIHAGWNAIGRRPPTPWHSCLAPTMHAPTLNHEP